jgi:hypothetical protein
MSRAAKLSLVAVGFLAAVVVAWVALEAYVAATAGPDRQAYGGMYAFGDSAFFVAVFGLAAVPATAAALYFLRPYASFWRCLVAGAVALSAVSLAAFVSYVGRIHSEEHRLLLGLAPLWILAAPLFAGGLLVAGLLAPQRRTRLALLAATAGHLFMFAYVSWSWRVGS